MKLVDILARDLKDWPEGVKAIEQSSRSFTIFEAGKYSLQSKGYSVGELADDRENAIVSRAQWQAAVDALKEGEAVWNGEGLPPVGTICEMQDEMGVWIQVEIFADHKHYVHGWDDDKRISYFSNLPAEFRPLRTAEQIAAEERLHQVRNALSAIHAGQLFPNDFARGNIVAATVEAMIEVGYRKQEAP